MQSLAIGAVLLIITTTIAAWDCSRIVKRKDWNAVRAETSEFQIIPVKNVIIAHTVTPECNTQQQCKERVKSIQNYFVNDLDYGDIAYNFLIGGDGNVYEGAGWHQVGAHTYGWNRIGLGVAFIGDFSEKTPPRSSMDALDGLLSCGVELGEISEDYRLYGHRQLVALESPGLRLYRLIKRMPHWTGNVVKE